MTQAPIAGWGVLQLVPRLSEGQDWAALAGVFDTGGSREGVGLFGWFVRKLWSERQLAGVHPVVQQAADGLDTVLRGSGARSPAYDGHPSSTTPARSPRRLTYRTVSRRNPFTLRATSRAVDAYRPATSQAEASLGRSPTLA